MKTKKPKQKVSDAEIKKIFAKHPPKDRNNGPKPNGEIIIVKKGKAKGK